MKPKLDFLILARDIITDTASNETSAIKIFDTLFILKGQTSLIYSLAVLGRVYLNSTGIIPNLQCKLKLSDPTGAEIRTEILSAGTINAEIGVNLSARFLLVLFQLEGRHKIDVSISTNGVDFIDLESPTYFQVKKQI
jgi:hypothetical protein